MVSRMRPTVPRLRINSEDMDVVGPPASPPPIAGSSNSAPNHFHSQHSNAMTKKENLAVLCQYDSVDFGDLEEVQVAICKLRYNPDAASSV